MNPLVQVIGALLIIAFVAGTGYSLLYNYKAAKDNVGLVTKLNEQHKIDVDNMKKITKDTNANDKVLADNYDTLRQKIDENQIEILQFIDMKQADLLNRMNMDKVNRRLDHSEANMLKQLVHREIAILKVLVKTEGKLMQQIDAVNNQTLDSVEARYAQMRKQIDDNAKRMTTLLANYKVANESNVNALRDAINQLDIMAEALQNQQNALLSKLNTTSTNFGALKDDVKNRFDYLLNMWNGEHTSQEYQMSQALTQNIYVNKNSLYIGVGTLNPGAKLDIKDSGDTRTRTTGGTAGYEMCVGGESLQCASLISDGLGKVHMNSAADQNIMLQTGALKKKGLGSVIVGTDTPPLSLPHKLFVNGSIGATQGIELGMDPAYKKDATAGFIGYNKASPDALDVMGAGQTSSGRKLKFWADAGSSFNGTVSTDSDLLVKGSATVNGNVTVGNQVTTNTANVKNAAITNLAATNIDVNGTTNITGPFNIKTQVTAFGDVKNQNKWSISVAPSDGERKMAVAPLGSDGNPITGSQFEFRPDGSIVSRGNISAPSGSIDTVNSGTVNVSGKLNINNVVTSIGLAPNRWLMHTSQTDTSKRLMFAPQSADGAGDWSHQFELNPNGNLTVPGVVISNDIVSSSDSRLKSNVQKIKGALDKLKHINGYTFDKQGAPARTTGVIAQEVQCVLPEAVHTKEDGYLSVAYGNMAGMIIEAIKDLDAKVRDLEREVKSAK